MEYQQWTYLVALVVATKYLKFVTPCVPYASPTTTNPILHHPLSLVHHHHLRRRHGFHRDQEAMETMYYFILCYLLFCMLKLVGVQEYNGVEVCCVLPDRKRFTFLVKIGTETLAPNHCYTA